MLRLAAIGLVAVISAGVSAKAVMSLDRGGQMAPAQVVAPPPAAVPAQSAAVGEPASIVKSADGHYWAEATVNGRAVHFLVDTGASAVALTLDDARRLGIEPRDLNYTYQVTTAAGQVRAAKVTLTTVAVAGAQVHDVDALVIEKGLQTSLLGMTYLGRLSQFEATQTSLILRP
jgi:aspartyl protease family protein